MTYLNRYFILQIVNFEVPILRFLNGIYSTKSKEIEIREIKIRKKNVEVTFTKLNTILTVIKFTM